MKCWKCSKIVTNLPEKIGFRACCIHCDADLHVCKNCRYYSVGKPNDCSVPGTDPVSDKEQSNLCEEFKPEDKPEQGSNTKRVRQIFGEDAIEKKPNFDDLFK